MRGTRSGGPRSRGATPTISTSRCGAAAPDRYPWPVDAAEVVRVLDALDAAGVGWGITGGWGIDALLRRETRSHADLDLGIASEAVDDAIDALEPLGYVLVRDE